MAGPVVLVWKEHKPIWLRPDGSEFTFRQGDDLYIDYDTVDDRRNGIYKCAASIIATSVTPKGTTPQTYDWTDFDSHVRDSEFVIRTATSPVDIVPWVAKTTYHLGDRVYVNGSYAHYYTCIVKEVTQDFFSVYLDDNYPRNEHNAPTERVISGIRNEGWYLYPRGPLTDIERVPKWPGMMYLCTDEDDRTIYAYTDGKGPVHGWWAYASVGSVYTSIFTPGMIISWLWSELDPGPTPPSGFIKCDGTRVSKFTYMALYAIIGDSYKQPTDPTDDLFRLPLSYNQIVFTGVI